LALIGKRTSSSHFLSRQRFLDGLDIRHNLDHRRVPVILNSVLLYFENVVQVVGIADQDLVSLGVQLIERDEVLEQ
jgi:hypothetical protein